MGLDSVELLVEIEEAFEICISNLEASRIITVGQFSQTIKRKKGAPSYAVIEEDPLYQQLVALICEKLGVSPEDISADTNVVNDLRLD